MTRSKYGHIRKRENETYRVYWIEYGERKSQAFNTKLDAENFLEVKRIQHYQSDKLINHRDYYYEVIVPTYSHISDRTKYDYENCWKTLSKYISNMKLVDVNWQVVQHTMNKINSPTKQKSCFKFWRRMLNYAVLDNLIPNNPCNSIIKLKPISHKIKYIYTKEEILSVLTKIKNTEFALPILLESLCGLRHEEYCGLDRSDIRIGENNWATISITKAVTYAGGKKIIKEPKTKTSTRNVLLHPVFVPYLRKHINTIKSHKSLQDYTDPLALTKRWKKYAEQNNIPYTAFGNLRTVYATLSAEAGCIDSIVSKSMGHSGNTVKDRNYLSRSLDSLKINAAILAGYLKPEELSNSIVDNNQLSLQNLQLLLNLRQL